MYVRHFRSLMKNIIAAEAVALAAHICVLMRPDRGLTKELINVYPEENLILHFIYGSVGKNTPSISEAAFLIGRETPLFIHAQINC